MKVEDIVVDCLTFPIGTGQEETRRDGLETIEAIRQLKAAYPTVQTTLGVSNVSFGLNPAARITLNSVFLNECVKAGLDSAIVHAAKILPMSKIQEEQREVALDLVYDRRREGYDPLSRFLDLFEGVDIASVRASRAEELAALPLGERLARRIIDGERNGLEADLQSALDNGSTALDIVNDHLLEGMKVVGELFGKGEMQLPFVLQSAEVMKTAVAWLEPHMEKTDEEGKGTIVLATVKGDVHDIGKNLVDIILSNNGFTVVNIGIKQPVSAILDAADTHRADVIGMSGLLVKSTVVMKENLEEMNSRGISTRVPGHPRRRGAHPAVRRAGPRRGLRGRGALRPRRLRGTAADGRADQRQARRPRRRAAGPAAAAGQAGRPARPARQPEDMPARSDVAIDNPIPEPPFWGSRVVKGIHLQEYASLLDERATFMGQWGLKSSRASDGPTYEELVETEGRPRLRMWLERIQAERMLEAAVVYGYFPVVSEGDDLVLLDVAEIDAAERYRFTFPRQQHGRHLCLADFFRPRESGEVDVLGPSVGHDGPADRRGDGRRCSPRTPTATTSSCTGSRCSSPSPSPSTGTSGCAPSSASPPRTRTSPRTTSTCATAAPGSPSATARAPTSRTAPSWSTCSSRSGSA